MLRAVLAALPLLLWGANLAAEPLHNVLPCPAPGGYALTDDLLGLVVAAPETAELIYFNTATERELKRVELDFKPSSLCRQGKMLYVAAQGTALVYAVELASGKVRGEFEIQGDAVASVACHAKQGPIYVTTASREVHCIDPTSGKVTKTSALGKYVAVTADGLHVITAFQPGDNEYDYQVEPGNRVPIPWDSTWGPRAQILKYKVKGSDLAFVTNQTNAGSNAWSFHLSPDGQRVALPSGGGWRPLEGTGGYITAVFSTTNLQTMLGQAPSAIVMAFHPTLDLTATGHDDGVRLYRGKTFKLAGEWKFKGNGSSALLAPAAKGTKLVFWNGGEAGQGLHFLPLELSAVERAALVKAYGELPPPVEITLAPEVKAPEVATRPAPSPASAAAMPRSSNRPRSATPTQPQVSSTPGIEPAAKVPTASAVKNAAPREEITAGFNDAKGMNADKKRFSPYPVGARGIAGGDGEPGWKGPWELKGDAKFTSFVNDVVYEGDGALYFAGGTGGVIRTFAAPWKTPFEIEQFVRVLEGGHLMCYVGEQEHATGPMWFVQDGKFLALHGTGQQYGPNHATDVGVTVDPEKWHKVLLKVYPQQHEYEFFVDDKKLGERFRFRADIGTINEVRYVSEREPGYLLDAITVRPLKE